MTQLTETLKYNNMLQPKHWCWRCDENYYNEADCESITETNKCVNCHKEVSFKKELVKLKKKNEKKIHTTSKSSHKLQPNSTLEKRP